MKPKGTQLTTKAMIMLLLLTFHAVSATQKFDTIAIDGNQKFNGQIVSALELLKQKSPNHYQLVKNSIATIKQAIKVNVEFENYPSLLDISDDYTFYSVYWCAAIIVNYANYTKRYNEFTTLYKTHIPQDFWTSFEAVSQSYNLKIKVLENIQAPISTIEYIQKQKKTHLQQHYKDNNHEKKQFDNITVIGTAEFNQHILAALDLLKQKAPENYHYLKDYIGIIKEADNNGLRYEDNPTVLAVSEKSALESPSWCANILLHYALDAYHLYLDKTQWNTPKTIAQNIKILTENLIKLNAPKNEINILNSLNETTEHSAAFNGTYHIKHFDKISIQGDLTFIQQITSALKVLKSSSPDNYRYVNNYITTIKQATNTALYKSLSTPVLQINNQTALKTLPILAGKIVYEAYQSFLFKKYVQTYDFTLPRDNWKNTDAHFYATNTQLLALYDIDPTNKLIPKLVKQNEAYIKAEKKQNTIGNNKDKFESITIIGTQEFNKRVSESLLLLKNKSSARFTEVAQYIGTIKQSKESNLLANTKPATIELSTEEVMYSLHWCAISIVNSAFYTEAYRKNNKDNPEKIWNNQTLYTNSLKLQLAVLKDLHAPEYLVDYLNNLIGNNKVMLTDKNHKNSDFDGVLINGSPKYNQQIMTALTLLKEKVPLNYNQVKNNIGIIKQSKKSGMDVYNNPPIFNFGKESALYSLTFCASSIVHDAHHSYLYKKYKKIYQETYGNNLPNNIWAGFNGELRAIEEQLSIMQAINAPLIEINDLKSADGTHGDVNQDGKITDDDYVLQDW